jgi:hypothetical protein
MSDFRQVLAEGVEQCADVATTVEPHPFHYASWFGVQVIVAAQSLDRLKAYEVRLRKTVVFDEWRRKLNRGDRLPRGRFFKGKMPGGKLHMIDEYWTMMHHLKHKANREMDRRN